MERSLRTFEAATDGLPLEQVVERAVPGLTFVTEAGQTSVVLVPSIAIRPLWVVTDHRTANVFAFPAPDRDARQASPPATITSITNSRSAPPRVTHCATTCSRPASLRRSIIRTRCTRRSHSPVSITGPVIFQRPLKLAPRWFRYRSIPSWRPINYRRLWTPSPYSFRVDRRIE